MYVFGSISDQSSVWSGGRRFSKSSTVGMRRMEITVYLWIILSLANFVLSQPNFNPQERYGKRADSNPSAETLPFFSGSRYGRSGNPNDVKSLKNDHQISGKSSSVQILPRADRFFLGSRYGKRGNNQTMQLQQLQTALTYYNRIQRINNRYITDNNNYNERNYYHPYYREFAMKRVRNEKFT